MPNSISGVKRQGIVGKDGKIEIQPSDLAEGTVVEVMVMTSEVMTSEVDGLSSSSASSTELQDETAYLLSTNANRRHLMASIQSAETENGLISFTSEEWNETNNIHS